MFDNTTPDLSKRQSWNSVRFTSWFNPLPPRTSLTLTLFGGAVLFVWFKSCLLCSTILSYFFFLHNIICDTQSVITVFVFHCCTSTDWLYKYNVLRPSTNQSFVSGKPYYYFDSTLRNDRLMAVLQAVNNRYLLQIYYSGCRRFK